MVEIDPKIQQGDGNHNLSSRKNSTIMNDNR